MDVPALRQLAALITTIPDDRPEWLKLLPSAMEEGITQFGRYYRFFWELAKRWKPGASLEIGTYKGSSIAHLAAGNPAGKCVTLDIELDATKIANDMKLANLLAITGDSGLSVDRCKILAPYDILFIDGLHDFNHCYGEYVLYRPLVKHGGFIFFDDIHVHREMEVAWEYIIDEKYEMNNLHWTGFGMCCVDQYHAPRSWSEVIEEATKKFKVAG